MSDAGLRSKTDSRDVLTHALALESRNALARVELAASEIGRFEATPRLRGMLETIHEAVGEIDSLLGTIGRLSSIDELPVVRGIAMTLPFERVLARLVPALRARGIELVPTLDVNALCSATCRIPEPSLERLLLAFLRLGLAQTQRGDVLRLDAHCEASEVVVELWRETTSSVVSHSQWTPELRLDVEAQLVEWAGCLEVDAARDRLCFRLTTESSDA